MGIARSKAYAGHSKGAQEDLESLVHVLENKRDELMLKVKSTRGAGSDVTREVQGGRTVMRMSDIRICTDNGEDGIDRFIAGFFKHAQGGDSGKKCAVDGAEHLISSHLCPLWSVNNGCGMEKEGFVILYLNFSFVRIDYYVYSYALSGSSWGRHVYKSGTCYVADIAVLDPSVDIKPGEIDFLLGQALYLPPLSSCKNDDECKHRETEYYAIMKMKIQLVQSIVLSRLLSKENISMDEIQCATEKLIETQELINCEFSKLGEAEFSTTKS